MFLAPSKVIQRWSDHVVFSKSFRIIRSWSEKKSVAECVSRSVRYLNCSSLHAPEKQLRRIWMRVESLFSDHFTDHCQLANWLSTSTARSSQGLDHKDQKLLEAETCKKGEVGETLMTQRNEIVSKFDFIYWWSTNPIGSMELVYLPTFPIKAKQQN